jgi:hypothetical protein
MPDELTQELLLEFLARKERLWRAQFPVHAAALDMLLAQKVEEYRQEGIRAARERGLYAVDRPAPEA